MKKGLNIGLIIGSSVAVLVTVGIIGWKQGWFGAQEEIATVSEQTPTTDYSGLIKAVQGWLNYQKANNWTVSKGSSDERINSAVWETIKSKTNGEKEALNILGLNQTQIVEIVKGLKSQLTF